MIEEASGATRRSQEAARTTPARIKIRQMLTVSHEQIQQVVVDHYATLGLRLHPGSIIIRVHPGGGSGYSRSNAHVGDTTIRLGDGRTEAAGLPTSMTLSPKALAQIVAERVGRAVGLDIAGEAVAFDVSDAGGSGFSSHSARLNGANIRLQLSI